MAAALTHVHLQLQFSTAQPEALLLLAAGPTDYLLLQLISGRLQVSDRALSFDESSQPLPQILLWGSTQAHRTSGTL